MGGLSIPADNGCAPSRQNTETGIGVVLDGDTLPPPLSRNSSGMDAYGYSDLSRSVEFMCIDLPM